MRFAVLKLPVFRGALSSRAAERMLFESCKTTPLNATPAQSVQLDTEEVVICNPTHPLLGRRFRVHHRIERPGKEPSVEVFFTPEILIRIPLSALTPPTEPPTTLTLASMQEVVATFRVAATSCPPQKTPSGPLCPST